MTTTTDARTLQLADQIETALAAGYQEYLDSCDEDRAQGYRAHYCEHGTNQWTDYDNICGPCEDGVSMGDAETRRTHALDMAERRMAAVTDVVSTWARLRQEHPQLSRQLDWAPWGAEIERLLAVPDSL